MRLLSTALGINFIVAIAACSVSEAHAQPAPLPSFNYSLPATVDSGVIRHTGTRSEQVWQEEIQIAGAQWIRLRFDQLTLAEGSQLLISGTDGSTQVLDTVSAEQWRGTSAYFNGDTVTVALVASGKGRGNRIRISEVIIDAPQNRTFQSICGPTDDRLPSDDVRVGRLVPGGCTAWIFDDMKHCLLTAGHCIGSDVVEFNVPLSTSDGTWVHPPPEDQYAIDLDSQQSKASGAGDDWGYFGVFPNSNTQLVPVQAQGAFFEFVSPTEADLITTRITGYGTTGPSVPPEWDSAQKTHAGPFSSWSGSTLYYEADTSGGNSGSPVIDDTTGKAIGIHSHGGCGSSGGANRGTSFTESDLQAAIADPQGVCAGGFTIEFVDGPPLQLSPSQSTIAPIHLTPVGNLIIDPTSVTLRFDDGSGYTELPVSHEGGDLYTATFPPIACGVKVPYYFKANSTTGTYTYEYPFGAPKTAFKVFSAEVMHTLFEDDFETDKDWVVQNFFVSGGAWERGIPVGGGDLYDPIDDYDGSGHCYLTENVDGPSAVDGGPALLTSPSFKVNDLGAIVSYARWYNAASDVNDFRVQVIENQFWPLTVETVSSSPGWVHQSFITSDYFPNAQTINVRFRVEGLSASMSEAGVDTVKITQPSCLPQMCQQDLGFAGPGSAVMSVCGDHLSDGGVAWLNISGLPPLTKVYLAISYTNNTQPILGGMLVPSAPTWILSYTADEAGVVQQLVNGGQDEVLYAQAVYEDDAQSLGYGFTNALRVELLP